jgi:hypothetical protein
MKAPVFLGALGLVLLGSYAVWRTYDRSPPEVITDPKSIPPEAAPMCPWREPESDLKAFFPTATSFEPETRILSGLRSELAQRLGRQPTGDENALRLNRIYQGTCPIGAILTRRVKGQYGAIELVLAADSDGKVRGVRLQRLREPEPIAAVLLNTNWLGSFTGKTAADPWLIGRDVLDVPSPSRESAQAVLEGVHSLLILSEASEHVATPRLAGEHHN